MAARAIFVAEQGVQPAVDLLRAVPVIGQLHMAERRTGTVQQRVEVQDDGLPPCDGAQRYARDLGAGLVIDRGGDRQDVLRRGHGRGQKTAAPALGRQQRRGQDVALAHRRPQLADFGVRLQVGALDIDVREPAALAADHLIARADHVAPGGDLDLLRPARVGQQRGDIQGNAGERGDGFGIGDLPVVADQAQRDLARRDFDRQAVLDPEDHPLILARCGQAGIEIGRPGVGVVGAAEARAVVVDDVERVLDHVVARRAGYVHEQLSLEGRQVEAGPHLAAVDHDGRGVRGQGLAPARHHRAGAVEQHEPDRGLRRAIA